MGLHHFRFHTVAIASLALLTGTVAVPGFAQPTTPTQPTQTPPENQTAQQCRPQNALVPANVAVILNSGSTNTPCYRILVPPSGDVTYVLGQKSGKGTIPASLRKKLFRNISAAQPLSKLPTKPNCAKPASFGTSISIKLGGEESPDLSCPGNAKAKALLNDANNIAKALKLTTQP